MKIAADLYDNGCRYIIDGELASQASANGASSSDVLMNVARILLLQAAREIRERNCPCDGCRKGVATIDIVCATLESVFGQKH